MAGPGMFFERLAVGEAFEIVRDGRQMYGVLVKVCPEHACAEEHVEAIRADCAGHHLLIGLRHLEPHRRYFERPSRMRVRPLGRRLFVPDEATVRMWAEEEAEVKRSLARSGMTE